MENLSVPTLAIVRGGCVSGGFELASSCDFIVAARRARFVFPESNLGIMTPQGGVYQLAERIRRRKTLEIAILSTLIGAAQMAAWNGVTMVVGEQTLIASPAELAGRLASHSTEFYARTKKLLRIWQDEGQPAARHALCGLSMPLFGSPAVQQALTKRRRCGRARPRSVRTKRDDDHAEVPLGQHALLPGPGNAVPACPISNRRTSVMKFVIRAAAATALATAFGAGIPRAQPAVPTGPVTRILAIGTLQPGADLAAARSILPREVRETAKLYLAGRIDQWFSLADRTGVVFVLNVTDPREAASMLEALPLGQAHLMHFELLPLAPLAPLRQLLGPTAEAP